MNGRPLLLCLALVLALSAAAAPANKNKAQAHFDIDAWGTDQGLLHDNVSVALQTRDGYLWIGTDGGLSRFDGVSFTSFRTRLVPGLIGDAVRSLFEDSSGILWIGTTRGLCRYTDGKIEAVLDFDAPQSVNAIGEDAQHDLWLATTKGIYRRHGGAGFAKFDSDPLVAGKSASSMYADSAGRIWFGLTNLSGVVYYEHGQFHVADSGTTIDGFVTDIQESPRGTVWFATRRSGLVRYRNGQFSRFEGNHELLTQNVSRIFADGTGSLWIGTFGIQRCNDDGTGAVETVATLPSPNIRQITRDREGSIWAATFGDGLLRIRPSRYKLLNVASGLPANFVRTVMEDSSGALYLAQGATGAVKIAPDGTITPLRLPPSEHERGEALCVYATRSGDVWLATQNMLYLCRGSEISAYPAYAAVRAIFEDHTGTVWFGTFENSLVCWKNGAFSVPRLPESVAKCVPCGFAEDADGTIYAATMQNGILRVQGAEVTVIDHHNGLPDDNTRTIMVDSDHNLWVGTRLGIAVRCNGRWRSQPWFCDAIDPFISDIVQIPGDELLLSTSRGIVRIARPQLLAALQESRPPQHLQQATITESARTGNIGTACFPGAWVAQSGDVMIAARKGVIVINPQNIHLDTHMAPVRIEHLIADGVDLGDKTDARLNAGARKLEIDYTALTFVQSQLVRFSYRLDGYDDDWVDAGTRRVAFYNNLSPGEYAFRVKAANSDGVWNDRGAVLRFTVPPLLYQTLWFRLGCVLGVGAGTLGLFSWRARRLVHRTSELQNQNIELERRIEERTAELAKSFEALKASENFYQSLVESLPQVIFRKDMEGRFTYANSAFAELIGHPLDRIIGRYESELYPESDVEEFRDVDRQAIETRSTIEFERIIEDGATQRHLHVKKVPLFNNNGQPIGVQVLLWDMTIFRETEARLKQAQTELIEASRLAGMAEVATGVLHNIGNALNSVNVSASVAVSRLRQSRVAGLEKVTSMLAAQGEKLGDFFASDPRSAKVTPYLVQLSDNLQTDRADVLRELENLLRGLDHLKAIVAAQQTYARASGVTEPVQPVELLEDALKIAAISGSNSIAVIPDFQPTPNITVQRQKVLQVLVNLLRNARDAMSEVQTVEKRLRLGVSLVDGDRVRFSVTDNGIGIAPDNLTRIFAYGFTTKKAGHGFGLHSSALVAKELGGALTVSSDGIGFGATFVLELPITPAS